MHLKVEGYDNDWDQKSCTLHSSHPSTSCFDILSFSLDKHRLYLVGRSTTNKRTIKMTATSRISSLQSVKGICVLKESKTTFKIEQSERCLLLKFRGLCQIHVRGVCHGWATIFYATSRKNWPSQKPSVRQGDHME